MNKLIAILLVGLTWACSSNLLHDNEAAAVQAVLDYYGGVCTQNKRVSTAHGEQEEFFEITLSQSQRVEQFAHKLALPASNIAYLFYQNLAEQQRQIAKLRVVICLANGLVKQFEFAVQDLDAMDTYVLLLHQVANKLKEQNYAGLLHDFDEDLRQQLTASKLKELCTPNDSIQAPIRQVYFQGYFLHELEDMHLVHLIGLLQRGQQLTPVSLMFSRESKKLRSIRFTR